MTVAAMTGLTVVPDRVDLIRKRAALERASRALAAERASLGRADGLADMGDFITAFSADNECQHGRLATDPTPECGCWGPITTTPPTTGQED